MDWKSKIKPNVLAVDAMLTVIALVFNFTSPESDIPGACVGAIIYSVKDVLGMKAAQ